MPLSLQAPILFGLIAALVTSAGLVAVAIRSDWTARQSGLFSLAAGGMLISLTLLHIAPEAILMSARAPAFLLTGFFGGLLLTSGINALFPEKAGGRARALTPLLAVGLHSFLDGVIYSVTFAASFESGVYASTSLILHEFAEGVIAFAILARHGFRVREALFWAFLAAGATTPFGALVSGLFLTGLGPEIVAALYALSAGLLIYVATGPLMQPLKEEPPIRGVAALGSGILIALILMILPIHGHGHEDHGHSADDGHFHPVNDPSGIHP
ncbi:metal cation transporter, zinc (Zn2+)-iron (Fe2+) permease (ZIP) family [Hyphomonas neptunium ATCC 15444]|uniref:Metal cation transporter, zinc (Zn2+)-iron (Fe2+) permease (ZIP) family n=2 Tax=Hyphomonas TaxID=85 RepID=Q0C5S5_HYPNA|nr:MULTISPECIES: ZIP family metal transporter [Hyphomonas]ABI78496.1 metal cation transporter, zinc (Zn2+)-iron (Fe2+) permease (ZIP) family [Hyphomonas neptunium ATCC 15444]KCZ89331.1 zinc/iron ABC transporter permease [Hyphomonas hirschiana VP5]